ncbi:MAG: O-methyltransferase [Bacteroidota bacterium]
MELVNILAGQYADGFCTDEDGLLQKINEYTTKHHAQPHMLSGKVQGQLLSMISQLLQPKRILEVGTFTGYSALCLAQGLQPGGKLYTLELRAEDAAIANNYFAESKYKEQIHTLIGNAKDIIPTLNETWDIVFIDADKTGYIDYYGLILPQVRKNGLVIADNVLFHGQVLEEEISGKNAKAIHAFNEHVKNDNRVEQVMLTVRDGLMLIRKK